MFEQALLSTCIENMTILRILDCTCNYQLWLCFRSVPIQFRMAELIRFKMEASVCIRQNVFQEESVLGRTKYANLINKEQSISILTIPVNFALGQQAFSFPALALMSKTEMLKKHTLKFSDVLYFFLACSVQNKKIDSVRKNMFIFFTQAVRHKESDAKCKK